MTEHAVAFAEPTAIRQPGVRRTLAATFLLTVVVGNALLITWLWYHGGNVTQVHDAGEALTSVARLTGLLGAYLALLQVLLLARLPMLERLVGLDRLSHWHRWNGHACLYLVLAHVAFSFYGYALMDRVSLPSEIGTMIGGGVYPGMVTATIGTVLFVVVVLSSIVIAKRRLRYELWYAVHLTAYAAIALSWFHQVPTGNELVLDNTAADYWLGLYLATLALLLAFRVIEPIVNALRFQLRVAAVVTERPGVVSLEISGRGLDRLGARGGQFMLWRFLTRDGWWKSHPFSLSALPHADSMRVTIKSLGDYTSRIGAIPVGTRVVAEGPFGVFTSAARRRDKVLLVGGGIGITPIRALLEELRGDVVVICRVVDEDELLFRDELQSLGARVHVVAGDHRAASGSRLLSAEHLRELVPDIAEREVYVCGPPAMADAVSASVRRSDVPPRNIHVERFAL